MSEAHHSAGLGVTAVHGFARLGHDLRKVWKTLSARLQHCHGPECLNNCWGASLGTSRICTSAHGSSSLEFSGDARLGPSPIPISAYMCARADMCCLHVGPSDNSLPLLCACPSISAPGWVQARRRTHRPIHMGRQQCMLQFQRSHQHCFAVAAGRAPTPPLAPVPRVRCPHVPPESLSSLRRCAVLLCDRLRVYLAC